MLLLDLLRLHLFLEAFRVHDGLEEQLVEVVQAADLLLEKLVDLVALCLFRLTGHLTLDVGPDLLERNHVILYQEGRQVKQALVHQRELALLLLSLLGCRRGITGKPIWGDLTHFEGVLDLEAHELGNLIPLPKLFDQFQVGQILYVILE